MTAQGITSRYVLSLMLVPILLAGLLVTSSPTPPLSADGGDDYGDAPGSYGTYSESGGAYHTVGSLYLGSGVDAEGDGHPSDLALGDDEHGTDDEDGVAFTGLLWPGSNLVVLYESSGTGYLDAWIDYNIDGDFLDAGEQILASHAVAAGTGWVFAGPGYVPPTATPGTTYARFRLSSAGGLGPTGGAPDGEVEDRMIIIMEGDDCYDRGDAPEPYPDAWGAQRPYAAFGQWIDSEASMQRSANADGDDINGARDDEDGKIFPTTLTSGESTGFNLMVVSEQLHPTLSATALFDWNQDGDWADPGESYTLSNLVEGNNQRLIDVPVSAISGETFARFELYCSGNLQEVEDYVMVVEGPTTVDFTVELKAGWNMVSVPLTLASNTPGDVFPNAEAIYEWNPLNKSYTIPNEILPEHGYWIAMSEGDSLTLNGLPCPNWTNNNVKTGWNMIGSVHGSTEEFTTPTDSPDGSVEGFAYWWDPLSKSYSFSTTIEPGNGYWIAATSDCSLSIGAPPPP